MDSTETMTNAKTEAEAETVEIKKEIPAQEQETVEISKESPGDEVLNEKQERERATALQLERRAEAYMERNQFNEALSDFRQSLNHYNKVNDRQSVARCHYRMGHAKEQLQKYTEAVDEYNEAKKIFLKIENMDDYDTVSDRLAKTHYFNSNIEAAVDEYQQSVDLGSKNGEIYNNLGFIQIALERYDDAQNNLKQAVKLRENTDSNEVHMSYNNLGVIEFIKGNYKEAADSFKKGIELDVRDPKEDRTIQYQVFMKPEFKGEEFSKFRSFDDVYTKACLMLNLSAAEGMMGLMDAAVETANNALTLDQDRPYLYESVGWLYINKGEEMRALDYFKRALPYDSANEELKNIIDMINPYINMKVGRNDPCPCGSGKKYKKCHGKSA